MENNTFKPFAIGDRVISEADGPGTIIEHQPVIKAFPVCALLDKGFKCRFDEKGRYHPAFPGSEHNIRHMTAEEMEQYPKPE